MIGDGRHKAGVRLTGLTMIHQGRGLWNVPGPDLETNVWGDQALIQMAPAQRATARTLTPRNRIKKAAL